jgi:hypothetical protein
MKLYLIRWRSLQDPRVQGIASHRLFLQKDAEQHCEWLNRVYHECVTRWPEEQGEGTDASSIQA